MANIQNLKAAEKLGVELEDLIRSINNSQAHLANVINLSAIIQADPQYSTWFTNAAWQAYWTSLSSAITTFIAAIPSVPGT